MTTTRESSGVPRSSSLVWLNTAGSTRAVTRYSKQVAMGVSEPSAVNDDDDDDRETQRSQLLQRKQHRPHHARSTGAEGAPRSNHDALAVGEVMHTATSHGRLAVVGGRERVAEVTESLLGA